MLRAKPPEIVLEDCVALRESNPVPIILSLENGLLQLLSPDQSFTHVSGSAC